MYKHPASFLLLFIIFISIESKSHSKSKLLIYEKLELQDTTAADLLYNKGDSIQKTGYFDQAWGYFEQAANIYKAEGDWGRAANSYERVSRNLSKMGNDSLCLIMTQKILEECGPHLDSNHLEVAKAYSMQGSTYTFLGQFDKALNNFKKAEAILNTHSKVDESALATVYSGFGSVKHFERNLDEALVYYFKSLEVRRSAFGEYHHKTAWCYTAIGMVYLEIGDNMQGYKYLKKSQEIKIKIEGEDHPNLAGTYEVLSAALARLGNFEQAFIYANKALKLVKSTHGKTHPWAVEISNGIASYYIDLEEYDQALTILKSNIGSSIKHVDEEQLIQTYTYLCKINNLLGSYKEALEYGRLAIEAMGKRKDADSTKIADVYNYYSSVYKNMGNEDRAEEYKLECIDIYERHYGVKNAAIAGTYNELAQIYLNQGRLDEAVKMIDMAEYANMITVKEKLKSSTIEHAHELSKRQKLESLVIRAKCYEDSYRANSDKNGIVLAMQTLVTADSLIQGIRSSLVQLEDKVNYSKMVPKIYEDAIDLNFEMYRSTGDMNFQNSMFYYSERNKSNILKETVSSGKMLKYANIPDSLIEKELSLKAQLSYNRSEYQKERTANRAADTTLLKKYENEIFDLNLEQEELLNIFKLEYPNYFKQAISTNLIKLNEIQDELNENSTLLEYFVGDQSIYTFVITKSDLSVHQQLKPQVFEMTIGGMHADIVNLDFEGYYQKARTLYQLLIEPVREEITGNRLIIVPDGALWHVNFDLLLTSERKSVHYRDLDYLMKDYAVSYAYSADLLVHDVKRIASNEAKMDILAFSFSTEDLDESGNKVGLGVLRDTGADLPGSREEIRAISELVEGDYYFGSYADEANFKANAGNYSVLHLAVHGEVNEKRPLNSRLRFTSAKDTIEDGSLHAYELYNMSLNADLAVLSACNTGAGQIVRGEGIMSLGRGFSYAGCRSLVLTQWAVPDETTPQLMKNFYQGLKNGLPKDVALQQAKLEYIKTTTDARSSPFYWGAFVFLGDRSKVQFENRNVLVYVAGLIMVLIAMAAVRRQRSKQEAIR